MKKSYSIALFLVATICKGQATDFPTSEDIKQGFVHNKVLASDTEIRKVVLNHGSRCAEKMIFFVDPDGTESVGKVFKRKSDFLRENEAIDNFQNIIQNINRYGESKPPFPLICNKKGHLTLNGVNVILFDKAQGQTLDELYGLNFLKTPDSKIREDFFSIGQHFGALDKFMQTESKSILIQGDSRGANFMYDDKNKQLYWIDLDELRVERKVSGIDKLDFLTKKMEEDTLSKIHNFIFRDLAFELIFSESLPQDMKNKQSSLSSAKDYAPYVKYIPQKQITPLRKKLKKLLVKFNKETLMVEAFGRGYIEQYPGGKEAYNSWIEQHSQHLLSDEDKEGLNSLQAEFGLKKTSFSDLRLY